MGEEPVEEIIKLYTTFKKQIFIAFDKNTTYSNERIEGEFFTRVKDTLVFDKQKFAWLIESKEFLPDSYTRYSNKIGLSSEGNFISQKNDVMLDFPYKDCFLQGGQDKEDQKKEEIFYHETIASDEVTRMLAPKIFTMQKGILRKVWGKILPLMKGNRSFKRIA